MNLSPTLSQVGEDAVIQTIMAAAPSSINGDDAAVLNAPAPNHRTVAATDMMVESVHFDLRWSTPQQVGIKLITRNFADIEAMGARPTAALFALAAPGDTRLDVIEGIAQGIAHACAPFNAQLVGGDVTRSSSLVLTLTALGTLGGDLPALRLDGAKVGHNVVVHGNLGYSAAGLALLQEFGAQQFTDPHSTHYELAPLVQAHCEPQLVPGRGVVARAAGATALTDNSDGLFKDLSAIARHSNVGIDLSSSAIAPDELLCKAAKLLNADPWHWVLAGGEDHSLLGTTAYAPAVGFRKIGRVVAASTHSLVSLDGEPLEHVGGWRAL